MMARDNNNNRKSDPPIIRKSTPMWRYIPFFFLCCAFVLFSDTKGTAGIELWNLKSTSGAAVTATNNTGTTKQDEESVSMPTPSFLRSQLRVDDDQPKLNQTSLGISLPFNATQNQILTEEGERISTLSQIKQRQIQSYNDGKGLMLNIHITHHAGTTFCGRVGRLGPTPPFACMHPDMNYTANEPTSPWPSTINHGRWWDDDLQRPNNTKYVVDTFRQHFHMVSAEYPCHSSLSLGNIDWEYENLLSVAIMRHPLDRFLAGGKSGPAGRKITQLTKSKQPVPSHLWWEYANDAQPDNCALKVFSNPPSFSENKSPKCCQGANTRAIHLENAKRLVKRFTYVLDIECLDESMLELGKQLNLPVEVEGNGHPRRTRPPAKERIGNETLYDFLVDKFRHDIALYEWSKEISLVNCKKNKKMKQNQ